MAALGGEDAIAVPTLPSGPSDEQETARRKFHDLRPKLLKLLDVPAPIEDVGVATGQVHVPSSLPSAAGAR